MRKQNNTMLRVAAGALTLAAAAAFIVPSAQQPDPNAWKDEYDAFKKGAKKEYDDFRAKANAEYADFMRKAWEEYPAHEPIRIPIEKKTPPPAEDASEPVFVEIVPVQIVRAPKPQPRPMPISIIKGTPSPVAVVVPRKGPVPQHIDARKGQAEQIGYTAPSDPSLANVNVPKHTKTPELVVTVIPEPDPFNFTPATADPSLANVNVPKHAKAPEAVDRKKGEADLFGFEALDKDLSLADVNVPKHASAPAAIEARKGQAEQIGYSAPAGEVAVHRVVVPIYEKEPGANFDFYGREVNIRYAGGFSLNSLDNNELADKWLLLSSEKYNPTLLDCLEARREMQLCDWAYMNFLMNFARKATATENEAVFLTNWILAQSGYNVRLGQNGDELLLLYATKHIVYNQSSWTFNGTSYYALSNNPTGRITICPAQMPNELEIDLAILNEQIFGDEMSDSHHFEVTRPTVLGYDVTVNIGLLDFYNTYPRNAYGGNVMTQWANYGNVPLASTIREQIYPAIREKIEGLNKYDAAVVLYNLVKRGYTYKVDDQVWGYDRVFFADEMMFYPYNDCEDRAILLSRLVRDLLDLDACLVYVPGHMMMAIDFADNEVPDKASRLEVDGRKFVIADPCYMGGTVGSLYKAYANVPTNAIILNR